MKRTPLYDGRTGNSLPHVFLYPGTMYCGTKPSVVTTVLGSCVATITAPPTAPPTTIGVHDTWYAPLAIVIGVAVVIDSPTASSSEPSVGSESRPSKWRWSRRRGRDVDRVAAGRLTACTRLVGALASADTSVRRVPEASWRSRNR